MGGCVETVSTAGAWLKESNINVPNFVKRYITCAPGDVGAVEFIPKILPFVLTATSKSFRSELLFGNSNELSAVFVQISSWWDAMFSVKLKQKFIAKRRETTSTVLEIY